MKYDPTKMPRDDIALEVAKLKPGDIVAFYCEKNDRLKWQTQEEPREWEVSRHIIRAHKKNRFETTLLYANPYRRTSKHYLPGHNYSLARSTFLARTWKKM